METVDCKALYWMMMAEGLCRNFPERYQKCDTDCDMLHVLLNSGCALMKSEWSPLKQAFGFVNHSGQEVFNFLTIKFPTERCIWVLYLHGNM